MQRVKQKPAQLPSRDITAADIERLMDYVRRRHMDSCCDQYGRPISLRDSVWAMLSADVVQEILVTHVRLKEQASES